MTEHHSEKPAEDALGFDALDKLLEEGILKGHARMDLALVVGAAFIVVMWGVFVFFPAAGIPFILDDYPIVVDNDAFHGFTTISEGWNGDSVRPLTALTFAVDWRLGGGSPGWLHVHNTLLHLLNAALVLLLCRSLFDRNRISEVLCLVPALVFLVHPLGATPALYIADRGALLGTFFALLTAQCYLANRATAALLTFTCAWASLSAVWALPFVLAAIDVVAFRRVRWPALLPLMLLAAALLVVHVSTRIYFDDPIPGIHGVLEQQRQFGHFVADLVTPPALLPIQPEFDGWALGPILCAVVLVAGVVLLRIAPVLGFSLFWVVVCFAAMSLLAEAGTFTAAASRYFAFAGSLLWMPGALARVPSGAPRTVAGLLLTALLLMFSRSTFVAAGAWQDEESLLHRAATASPKASSIDDRLGTLYLERGLAQAALSSEAPGSSDSVMASESARTAYANAIPYLQRAIDRDAGNSTAWLHLGEALNATGDRLGALNAFEQARLTDPWSPVTCTRLAESILAHAGSAPPHETLVRALDLYASARAFGPLSERDAAQYAALLTRVGDFEGADALLQESLEATDSELLRSLRARNAQSVNTLREREARLATLTGRERIYEEASLLNLRRHYLRSSYLLQAELRENGFNEQMWLLLGQNRRLMRQVQGFIDEYRNADVPQSAWDALRQAFVDANAPEAARLIPGVQN